MCPEAYFSVMPPQGLGPSCRKDYWISTRRWCLQVMVLMLWIFTALAAAFLIVDFVLKFVWVRPDVPSFKCLAYPPRGC